MLKDRGHKGSWKGVGGSGGQSRMKKKSYGNIHTINDRGIHEIYESLGTVANGGNGNGGNAGNNGTNANSGSNAMPGSSAPSSPWSSPLMGRKSIVTIAPQIDRSAAGKILPLGQ